jgi:hypothetical protein
MFLVLSWILGTLLNNKVKEPPENEGKASRGGPEEVDDDRSWEAFLLVILFYILLLFFVSSIFDFFENMVYGTVSAKAYRRVGGSSTGRRQVWRIRFILFILISTRFPPFHRTILDS